MGFTVMALWYQQCTGACVLAHTNTLMRPCSERKHGFSATCLQSSDGWWTATVLLLFFSLFGFAVWSGVKENMRANKRYRVGARGWPIPRLFHAKQLLSMRP